MQEIKFGGKALSDAQKVLIMVHGRGGSAEDILSLAVEFNLQEFAILAPQANGNSWYPRSFLSPRTDNEPYLSDSLSQLKDILKNLKSKGFVSSQIFMLGFSQGACLILDFAASNAERFGGIVSFTGGMIGEFLDHRNYNGDFDQTPVFIGTSDPDPHVPVSRVRETTILYQNMGAKVTEIIYKNMGHTVSEAEIFQVNKIIFGEVSA